MKRKTYQKFLSMLLAVIMLVGVIPMNTFAAINYDEDGTTDDYYKLISKKDWQIAPGIEETEVVLNNEAGTYRQVVHTAKIDWNNPYTKVIPGYKGMIPEAGNYGTESVSTQALNAEKLGYGNVVVATNALLSWYNDSYYTAHPELIGEPLGYSILNGYYYENSRGQTGGMSGGSSNAQVVINYDVHPETGETRPADMPKVLMRNCGDPLTGWEENSFSVWQWLVKPDANGVPQNVYSQSHSGPESRTFIGITADGEIILSVVDGGQAPYSNGFGKYEMGDYMIKMGCIYAANCDGGGSTTFCSQRPGEDLKVNCSLADGGERPTTNTILVISTAPADGVFANATISSQYDYYTPGSSVQFTALGTDAVGTKVDIPSDVVWTVEQTDMGTISDGIFVSSGKEGIATIQMIYNGEIVGERSINIVTPDSLTFDQPIVTIPFGKTVNIPAKASIGNGLYEIGVGENDITYTIDNPELGSFNGAQFVAVEEADAPANLVGNVTATLNMGSKPTATVQFKLGKGSEILWGFENGQTDIDEWNVINNRTGTHWAYDLDLSLATREDGQVHDGNYSMRLVTNGLHSKDSHSEQYAYIRLGVDGDAVELENARSIGFWLYVPEDNIQCWVQGHYKYDSNNDGVLDATATVNMMDSENVYYNIDESGWHYLEMDVSAYEKIALAYSQQFDVDPSDGTSGTKGEFFIDIIFHKAINNILWQTNGSINGQYTYYLDSFTVDYSEAVDDREAPIIGKIYIDGTTPLVKRDVVTTTNSVLNLSAEVVDATVKQDANQQEYPLTNISGLDASSAKVYIDGVEVESVFENGKLLATVTLADGYHRVKYEICDNAGNKAVVIRVVKVESGVDASTVELVPEDATLDRIPYGSIYWMNLKANKIETIQSVSTVIDLNNVNHWQLDHMVLAEGFTASYTIAEETNTATITFTRTGENTQTDEAVLAKIPVRILNFDDDIQVPGYTAETYWTTYKFWPQDMKMDVDKGEITFVDGYTSSVLNTFSNEEFHVDTETYTHMAGMDKTYWSEHGTVHVHTPVALDDKAATCVEDGYTGRTFCEVCNSVVEWGTTIPATGHTYAVVDGKLACECSKELNKTGLQTIDSNNYYTIAGNLVKGWQQVDDDWYYFGDDYAGINGKHTFVGVEYDFVEGLVEGVWKYYEGKGTRYYYGPGYYYNVGRSQLSNYVFETIDGETYAFDRDGYRYEGYSVLTTPGGISTLYQFTDEGVLIGEADMGDYTGIFVCDRTTTYLKDGKPFAAGLVKDGDDYYYIASGCNAVVGNYDVTRPNGILLPGFYQFAEDGKMINPPQYADGPNSDGSFYKNGEKLIAYQLVEFNGDYYFISDYNKYVRNQTVYLSARFVGAYGLSVGYYDFDETGKMILKNGPQEDGYFYLNDVQQKAYQLIEFEGNYYFINDGNKYAANKRIYLSTRFVDGTGLPVGYYDFDETGKMLVNHGPEADGCFYLNNVKQKAYQLVEFDGNYYFIDSGNKYATNRKIYLSARFVDAFGLAVGYYDFDETGKMDTKSGPATDGYFYLNGAKQKAYQLIKFDGAYYFVDAGDKYAISKRIYLSARFVDEYGLPVGYYDFDETGKMILKNGPDVDGYFYLNNVKQRAYQLVEFEGNYYFINDNNKYAVNKRIYLSARFVDDFDLPVGYYDFDETGKMIIKNGPDADGSFYLDNVKQRAYQLIEFDGNYYFIDSGNKYATNKRIFLSERFVDGTNFPVGYYDFDETGKMVIKNGPNADGYFYINNVKQPAHTLINYEGDYYYVGSGGKYISGKWQFTGMEKEAFIGSDVRYWHHSFDDEGKMIGYYKGIPNGRDIGDIWNLQTTDGKDIKSGLLIRGCELDNANYFFPEDMIALGIDRLQNEFHVKTDMDLRNASTVGLDVFGDDVNHKIYDMVLYEEIFTEDGKAKMKEIFTDLSNPDNYPIYMHCTHGVDRVGTVSFILELALGVPYQSAVYEYTLSVGSYGQSIVNVYNVLNSSYSGATSKDKAEAYLKDCGITDEQIASLRSIYLDD